MFDAQTSALAEQNLGGLTPSARHLSSLQSQHLRALASWTAAAMTPLFTGATRHVPQSADMSAHSKTFRRFGWFMERTRVEMESRSVRGGVSRFPTISSVFSATLWRTQNREKPLSKLTQFQPLAYLLKVIKGNLRVKNSELFYGHFYTKIIGKSGENHQKNRSNLPKKHAIFDVLYSACFWACAACPVVFPLSLTAVLRIANVNASR
jgi:hypothetical protein